MGQDFPGQSRQLSDLWVVYFQGIFLGWDMLGGTGEWGLFACLCFCFHLVLTLCIKLKTSSCL